MKICHTVLLICAMVMAAVLPLTAQTSEAVPKYDLATEATFKGTILDISERTCPVSGGMGFHFTLKVGDGKTIEVHVTTTKMMKTYDIVLNKGDQVEVRGSKVKFGGVDTIFARNVVRGNDIFIFRDKSGNPAW